MILLESYLYEHDALGQMPKAEEDTVQNSKIVMRDRKSCRAGVTLDRAGEI